MTDTTPPPDDDTEDLLGDLQRFAASDGMVRAAQTLDPGEEEPVRELVARLPDYQSHVDQALLLQKAGNNGAALDEQRQATDLMHTTLVPAARNRSSTSTSGNKPL